MSRCSNLIFRLQRLTQKLTFLSRSDSLVENQLRRQFAKLQIVTKIKQGQLFLTVGHVLFWLLFNCQVRINKNMSERCDELKQCLCKACQKDTVVFIGNAFLDNCSA